MKTRTLALTSILVAASASAQAPVASRIDGAFGKKLGDLVDVGGEKLVRGPEGLQYAVVFVPTEGYPGLSTFAVSITPYSHKIFRVEASGTLPTAAAVENLRRTLELKYGPFVRFEDSATAARWKFADGERSIVLTVADRLVRLFYTDDSLAAAARIESTTGAAAAEGKSL
jgi:hypothetical protein